VVKTQIKYLIFLISILLISCQTTRVQIPAPGRLGEPREGQTKPNPEKGHTVEMREDPVARYMRALTIEQKIGQRFIAHIKGTELTPETVHLIQDVYVGGVILYPWNVESKDQVKSLIDVIQQKAAENNLPLKLFICVDQEGGRVNAFKIKEVTRFPAPYYWAQYEDLYFVEAAAYITCREIAALGCNMNFAPVLDLYGNPDSTIIGDRSMGKDPSRVGMFGISYLRGAERAGVIAVFKHFPGHGSTTVDSHSRLPVVDTEESELLKKDFWPFRMVIENGAEAVMTAHVLFSRIDPDYPVTLSERILRGMLRNQFGFQGVVVSDGLSMGALSYYYELTETLRLLFKSGVDLILVHSKYDIDDLKSRVYDLYTRGEITKDEIDEGVERILRLKLKYGLLPR
jgi:beta-N-acetylhexosaminidase